MQERWILKVTDYLKIVIDKLNTANFIINRFNSFMGKTQDKYSGFLVDENSIIWWSLHYCHFMFLSKLFLNKQIKNNNFKEMHFLTNFTI